jgi:hypothetical protein
MDLMQKLGVQEVKDLASAVAKTGAAAAKILADGQVTLSDTVHLPGVLAGLKGFADVEYLALLPELKDLDEAERAELAKDFQSKFDIPNDTVEAVVEQGYALLLEGLDAVMAFLKIGQQVKV